MCPVKNILRGRRRPVAYVALPARDGNPVRLLLGPFDEVGVARSAIAAVRDMLDDATERSALDIIQVHVRDGMVPSGELNHDILVAWAIRNDTLAGALAD